MGNSLKIGGRAARHLLLGHSCENRRPESSADALKYPGGSAGMRNLLPFKPNPITRTYPVVIHWTAEKVRFHICRNRMDRHIDHGGIKKRCKSTHHQNSGRPEFS